MASPDLSLDDLNGGFLGVKHLILHVDYAMALTVEYDGQPGDPQVSLILGPARYESQMIDECLAEHRDELSIRLLRCPRCAHPGTSRRDTICKDCGSPLEAVRDTSEEWLRKQAWERLRWEVPGFQARSVVPKWLVQAHYEGGVQPPELCVPLSLVFRLLLEDMQGTRRRHIRECWDHLCLGKSVGDVLPRGDTIEEKLRHYLIVRVKLTAGYNWMLGAARQYPEFKDGWDEFQGIRRFPPAVTLDRRAVFGPVMPNIARDPSQDVLAETAASNIGAKPATGGDDTKLRVKVHAETKVVEIDGTPYPLSGREESKKRLVKFIQALIGAKGAPVSATDYEIRTRDIERQHDKIRSLIGDDAKPGSGYRIPPEKLMA